MRKHDLLRMDLISHKPWEQRPPGSEFSAVANGQPAEGNRTLRPANPGSLGQLARRIGSRSALAFLLAFVMFAGPAAQPAAALPAAGVAIGVVVSFGPPPLPYYAQPLCPGPGYIWTPGYWAWDPDYGYYWVPGTWVLAPFEGALWTPGYWGWADDDDGFLWYPGYWGPVVGFYGGIVYGYGYTGYGYAGGYWDRGRLYYNRSVNNISTTNITNVYSRTVVNNFNGSRVSYNGGTGGIAARPTRTQLAVHRERRFGPVEQQIRQRDIARSDPQQRASVNRGRPAIAATRTPGDFRGRGAVAAREAGGRYEQPPVSHARAPQRARVERNSTPRAERAPSMAPGRSAPAMRPARQIREPRTEPQVRVFRQSAPARPPREVRQPMERRAAPPQRAVVNGRSSAHFESHGRAGSPHVNQHQDKNPRKPHGPHR
jgi:WXXGXW repeat (2 copies)